jgi:multiple sugar transport system permease protein
MFFAFPILASGFYSFTAFNIFQDPKWVGLGNYEALFADPRFYKSLYNTLYLAVIGVPLALVLALGLALLLNTKVRGQPIYRALLYLPTIVPVVVAVYIWRWLLNAQYGWVNEILSFLGLGRPLWLHDPSWTKPAILLIALWMIGGTVIIYLAALKDVPNELLEAATLDGAGWWRRFRHIIVPIITPVTLFQLVVTLIAYLQIFTQPYLLGNEPNSNANLAMGGPGESMLTYAMYIYQNAFQYLKMGYASALAWVLFMVVLVITLLIFGSSRRWVHYGN